MNPFASRSPIFLVVLLLGGGLFHSAQAQLQHVQQTIYGMDCAPCAHAMERSLSAIEGVATVSVSLNEGRATIDLTETNTVSYREIRAAVTDGGFSVETATLEARGTLRRTENRWILETPVGEQFVLRTEDTAGAEEGGFRDLEPDQQVVVTGQVPASPENTDSHWPLRPQEVRPAT